MSQSNDVGKQLLLSVRLQEVGNEDRLMGLGFWCVFFSAAFTGAYLNFVE